MPLKAQRLCRAPGCRELTRDAYCHEHAKQRRQEQEARTDRSSKHLYNSARWKAMRLAQLEREPLCCDCRAEGKIVLATIADHDIPHKNDPAAFFDASRLKSRCKHHHDLKTATIDGGFGRPAK